MSILDHIIRAFGPDPTAIAAGLTIEPVGRFGTHRYSGVPTAILARQIAAERASRPVPAPWIDPVPVPDPAPADCRVIDTANRRELEARYPELAAPLPARRAPAGELPAAPIAEPAPAGAVLAALDASHAVDQSGARTVLAGLREVGGHLDALCAALTTRQEVPRG